jgi:hypothetical protein
MPLSHSSKESHPSMFHQHTSKAGKLFTAVQAPVDDTATQVDSLRHASEDMYAQAGGAVPTI